MERGGGPAGEGRRPAASPAGPAAERGGGPAGEGRRPAASPAGPAAEQGGRAAVQAPPPNPLLHPRTLLQRKTNPSTEDAEHLPLADGQNTLQLSPAQQKAIGGTSHPYQNSNPPTEPETSIHPTASQRDHPSHSLSRPSEAMSEFSASLFGGTLVHTSAAPDSAVEEEGAVAIDGSSTTTTTEEPLGEAASPRDVRRSGGGAGDVLPPRRQREAGLFSRSHDASHEEEEFDPAPRTGRWAEELDLAPRTGGRRRARPDPRSLPQHPRPGAPGPAPGAATSDQPSATVATAAAAAVPNEGNDTNDAQETSAITHGATTADTTVTEEHYNTPRTEQIYDLNQTLVNILADGFTANSDKDLSTGSTTVEVSTNGSGLPGVVSPNAPDVTVDLAPWKPEAGSTQGQGTDAPLTGTGSAVLSADAASSSPAGGPGEAAAGSASPAADERTDPDGAVSATTRPALTTNATDSLLTNATQSPPALSSTDKQSLVGDVHGGSSGPTTHPPPGRQSASPGDPDPPPPGPTTPSPDMAKTSSASLDTTISCDGLLCLDVDGEALYNVSDVNATAFELTPSDAASAADGSARGPLVWEMLFLVVMVMAGITGNALVVIAVVVEKKLRNVTNYFLVSLAVADCLVSLVVMPCSIVHELMGEYSLYLHLAVTRDHF